MTTATLTLADGRTIEVAVRDTGPVPDDATFERDAEGDEAHVRARLAASPTTRVRIHADVALGYNGIVVRVAAGRRTLPLPLAEVYRASRYPRRRPARPHFPPDPLPKPDPDAERLFAADAGANARHAERIARWLELRARQDPRHAYLALMDEAIRRTPDDLDRRERIGNRLRVAAAMGLASPEGA